jgi:hypothetical protein
MMSSTDRRMVGRWLSTLVVSMRPTRAKSASRASAFFRGVTSIVNTDTPPSDPGYSRTSYLRRCEVRVRKCSRPWTKR